MHELGPSGAVNKNSPNLGPRLSIVDHKGNLLSRIGEPHAGLTPNAFLAPHGVCVDSRGDIYVGEVSWTLWPQIYDQPRPEVLRTMRKFEKVR